MRRYGVCGLLRCSVAGVEFLVRAGEQSGRGSGELGRLGELGASWSDLSDSDSKSERSERSDSLTLPRMAAQDSSGVT
jgi:hypothetical protein